MTTVLDSLLGEAAVGKPGTNWKQVTPANRKKVDPLVKHWMSKPHPWQACVDELTPEKGADAAKRICSVVKDMGERTTKWRKGGKKVTEEAVFAGMVVEAQARISVFEEVFGEGGARKIANMRRTGNATADAIIEGAFQDLSTLYLAGVISEEEMLPVPLAEAFVEREHPRGVGVHGGEFVKKLGASIVAALPAHATARITPGEGTRRPSAAVRSGDRAALRGRQTHLPAANDGSDRKLTEAQLAKGAGQGPWSRHVKATADGLKGGSILDTDTHYRDPASGNYTPERIQLHARIMKLLFQGAAAHPQSAEANFLAGGPASGKSTLVRNGDVTIPGDAVDINPDIIKTMLPEYQALLAAGDPRASSKVHEESSHIAQWALNLAIARKHHVTVDGVGNSGPGKFAEKIQRIVKRGYKVRVDYATVDVNTAIARSVARGKKEGRFVPEGYLRAAHAGVSGRYLDGVSKLDGIEIRIWDMQGKRPKLVAQHYPGSAVKVVKQKLYDSFIAKATENPPNA